MQVTYTEIAKLVNEIDGSNVDRKVIKRRMVDVNVELEDLDTPEKVDFAVDCCSLNRGAWKVIERLYALVKELIEENIRLNKLLEDK